MKTTRQLLFWVFILFALGGRAQTQRCWEKEGIHKFHTPSELKFIKKNNQQQISDWIRENEQSVAFRKVETIPVVVHVVWNTDEQNISDEQIFSQIDILNTDFRALNAEIPDVEPAFKDLVADIEIEFCLANIDPDGNPTNGITRTKTDRTFFVFDDQSLYQTARGGKTSWGQKDYLNIWVANSQTILGYGSKPNVGPAFMQGIAVKYNCFGNIGSALENEPFNLGRTATHEMGHFFNLCHLFGKDCIDDADGITDTPVSQRNYSGQCPSGQESSCGNLDMYQNFMNYTEDACMALFSKGQKAFMIAALNTLRPNLITSEKCQGVRPSNSDFEFMVAPNPVNNTILLKTKSTYFPKGDLKIFDAAGKLMIDVPDHATRNILSVEKLESGVYFLDFRSGINRQVLKFVKM